MVPGLDGHWRSTKCYTLEVIRCFEHYQFWNKRPSICVNQCLGQFCFDFSHHGWHWRLIHSMCNPWTTVPSLLFLIYTPNYSGVFSYRFYPCLKPPPNHVWCPTRDPGVLMWPLLTNAWPLRDIGADWPWGHIEGHGSRGTIARVSKEGVSFNHQGGWFNTKKHYQGCKSIAYNRHDISIGISTIK